MTLTTEYGCAFLSYLRQYIHRSVPSLTKSRNHWLVLKIKFFWNWFWNFTKIFRVKSKCLALKLNHHRKTEDLVYIHTYHFGILNWLFCLCSLQTSFPKTCNPTSLYRHWSWRKNRVRSRYYARVYFSIIIRLR